MPSPIAHLGMGYAIYRYYKAILPEDQTYSWKFPFRMIMLSGLSMLPDLDVIPAIIFSDMKAYHNNVSHSLLFAIPVALLMAGIFHRTYQSSFWLWFLVCFISYDLHVVLDLLTVGRGVMLFWPLSQNRIVPPIRIFYGLQWGLGWFNIRHLWTIFSESVFVLVLMLVVNYFVGSTKKPNAVFSQGS
jgi:membrane-bound metal-dependent hydrolase YbcI (DUF457 family)